MLAFRWPCAGSTSLLLMLAVCALSGCQTPSAPVDRGAAQAAAPAPSAEPAAAAAPPPPAAAPTPADEARADKLARQAVDALDNGKVDAARALIEEALQAVPNHELALKLRRQVDGELPSGPSWRYNLCPEDTLSKVAERFLKDRFLFWYIARLNNITVPKDIKLGQSLQIPGIAPSNDRIACPGRTPVPAAAVPPAAPVPPPPPAPSAQAQAGQEVAAGDLCARKPDPDCAFRHYDAALRLLPDSPEIRAKQVSARKALVAAIMKAGEAARVNQELNCALRQFERALALDPDNRRAADQRLRVSDLIAKYKRNFPDRSLPERCSQPAPGE